MRSSLLIYLFVFIILIIPSSMAYSKQEVTNKEAFCNCAIFRLDDVQEGELEAAQIDLLNLFISKNESLSLGLIMDSINDTQSPLIKKIVYGSQKNLFDLALHGFHHIDYTQLTAEEQTTALEEGNKKMQQIFGEKSLIFIPPLSVFNNQTLNSMMELGINVISSDIPEEKKFTEGKSIFVAKDQHQDINNDKMLKQKDVDQKIYHLPATVFFKDFEKGSWVRIPNDEIIANVTNNIEKYGYSVIVLHPQDFALLDNKTETEQNTFINSIDTKGMSDLSKLLDILLSNNIKVKEFADVTNRSESCTTMSPDNTTLNSRLPGGGCHPNTGLVDLENKNTMIGGKKISSLIDSINDHLNNTRKLLNEGNVSTINNTLRLAEEDLSLLGEKLNHIGASVYKCTVSDC
jgi:peptidoglycan/xylan/chitin deacetylase (PgdA/CDA1 family)